MTAKDSRAAASNTMNVAALGLGFFDISWRIARLFISTTLLLAFREGRKMKTRSSRILAIMLATLFVFTFFAAEDVFAQKRVKMTACGAGPGAAAFVSTGGLAALVTKQSKSVEMISRATKGFVQNIRLLGTGECDLAGTSGPLCASALKGDHPYKKKYTNFYGFGPLNIPVYFHIITLARTKIRNFEQLKNARISYALRGSNSEYVTTLAMKWAGFFDTQHREYIRWDMAASHLIDGKLDAFTIPNPVNSPSVIKASTGGDIFLISLPDSVIKKFSEFNPGYYKATIPANSYKGQTEPATTMAYTAFYVVRKDVPADNVYEVYKHYMSQYARKFLPSVQPAWITGLNAAPDYKTFQLLKLKLHPGVVRYLKEYNYKVPADLIP